MRPSGTVAFLFTDIEGSSALWEADPTAMREALVEHEHVLATSIEAHGGAIFASMGDGVGAAFPRSGDAVAAAVELQELLGADNPPAGGGLRVRMGIHAGEAEERDGSYYGPTVNRAARLMTTANGGQIVVSEAAVRLLPVGTPVELHDLGSHRFAGISEPMRVFGLSSGRLPWLDRPLRSLNATGNLPVPVGRFVGRESEVRRLAKALMTQPVITLTGPAGVGKTRLAVEVGRSVLESYPDGVWIVELAAVNEPGAVVHIAAEALGLQAQGLRPVDALVDAVGGRRSLLLLDNCEHVRHAAAEFVGALAGRARSLRILATSREPLRCAAEQVWPVRPLAAIHEAVELFCDRAAMADSSFRLDSEARLVVERVCGQLDGLPLAIELAAGRSRAFSLEELSDRLQDRFRLLRSRGVDRSDRHHTLEAAIDWSYQLLDKQERTMFDRLTVFMGGFDRAATEHVCGFDPIEPKDTDDLLASLVDRSLITADRSEPVTRFAQLETMRQFAQARLEERDEYATVRTRHVEHYVAYAARADWLWRSPGNTHAGDLFVREWDNLRSAHAWTVTTGDVDNALGLALAITPWATTSGIRLEVSDWFDRTLRLAEQHDRLSPELLGIAALSTHVAGDEEGAERLAVAGIRLAVDAEGTDTAFCWFNRMCAAVFLGQPGPAVDAALALLRSLESGGDSFDFVTLGCYALVLLNKDMVPEWHARLHEVAARLGNPVADAVMAYGTVLERWRLGDLDTAAALIDDVIARARRAGVGTIVFNTIWMRIVLSIEVGQHDQRVPRAIRQMLDRMRYVPHPWTHRWWLIDAIAGYLAVIGALEPAAVLIRAFDAHRLPNLYLTKIHALTTERIETGDGVSLHQGNRGSTFTPDETLSYAEQQLNALLTSATAATRQPS
jgi:predicted ATPase/class 3 adenylate cyclase